MISVDSAIQIIVDSVLRLPAQRIPLDQALGLELADEVVSPVDVPPFCKAMMDGVALRCADFDAHGDSLNVQSTITAGDAVPPQLLPGSVCRIMTGAPLPEGADAVIPHEELAEAIPNWQDAESVRLQDRPRSNQNLMKRGELVRTGDHVLSPGARITPATLAFLMELGLNSVTVYPSVTATVLSTGSELVEWPAVPPPGSIRNTNGPMLVSLLREFGCAISYLGVAADDTTELRAKLEQGLHSDLLVITGGVSVGDRDLVPMLLEQLQVRPRFHGVAVKPGKPIWFGARQGTFVFGLPGNPVSALVGFHVFIRPLLTQLNGNPPRNDWVDAPLVERYSFSGRRETYVPARRENGCVKILPWQGSSDLRTLATAAGLVRFPAGDRSYSIGELVPYLPLSFRRDEDS